MLHVGVCCNVVSVLYSLVVTCWERADLLAAVCVVFCHFPKCFPIHIRIKYEVGAVKLLKSSSKIFYLTVPRRFFFCGSFYVLFVFAMPLCASVYMCLVVTCWETG